jgi:hypothetical protein
LKLELDRLKKTQQNDQSRYPSEAKDWFGKLRETWERAIEEMLFNDAVQRFRSTVETLRLKEVQVEAADYVSIEKAMARCSQFLRGHDKSSALDTTMPTTHELTRDLKELEDFVGKIAKRRAQVRDKRRVGRCRSVPLDSR